MSDSDLHPKSSPTRDDLVARLDLMQNMIAEGRSTTARHGWMFVMWGLIYCVSMTWGSFLPFGAFAWPVCVTFGWVTHFVVARRQRAAGVNLANPREYSIRPMWQAHGVGIMLFVLAAVFTHNIASPIALSAILFSIGLAHATSALILRWAPQGIAAAVWWIAGIAALIFTRPADLFAIFLVATLLGMVLFGLYMMAIERRCDVPPALPHHA